MPLSYRNFFSKFTLNFIKKMSSTQLQYQSVMKNCKSLFNKKMRDYGSAWRILRLTSLTDQIFIKAQRIRSLQTKLTRKVDEGELSLIHI